MRRRSLSTIAKERSLGGRKVPSRKGAACIYKSPGSGNIKCKIEGRTVHGQMGLRVTTSKGNWHKGDYFYADPHRIYPPRRKRTITRRSR